VSLPEFEEDESDEDYVPPDTGSKHRQSTPDSPERNKKLFVDQHLESLTLGGRPTISNLSDPDEQTQGKLPDSQPGLSVPSLESQPGQYTVGAPSRQETSQQLPLINLQSTDETFNSPLTTLGIELGADDMVDDQPRASGSFDQEPNALGSGDSPRGQQDNNDHGQNREHPVVNQQLETRSSEETDQEQFQYESIISIVDHRGRGRHIRYSVAYEDGLRSWEPMSHMGECPQALIKYRKALKVKNQQAYRLKQHIRLNGF